jgi:hypothetical protein
VELIEGGSDIPLTFDRLQQYIDATQNFYLGDGICLQVEVSFCAACVFFSYVSFMSQAVRAGIASVFPPNSLAILGPLGLLQALGCMKVRFAALFHSRKFSSTMTG